MRKNDMHATDANDYYYYYGSARIRIGCWDTKSHREHGHQHLFNETNANAPNYNKQKIMTQLGDVVHIALPRELKKPAQPTELYSGAKQNARTIQWQQIFF